MLIIVPLGAGGSSATPVNSEREVTKEVPVLTNGTFAVSFKLSSVTTKGSSDVGKKQSEFVPFRCVS